MHEGHRPSWGILPWKHTEHLLQQNPKLISNIYETTDTTKRPTKHRPDMRKNHRHYKSLCLPPDQKRQRAANGKSDTPKNRRTPKSQKGLTRE